MIERLGPYPRMADSGVRWLDEVPAHWEVLKLGQFGRLSKGNGGSKEDEVPEGIPCVRYGDLYTTHEYFINQSRSFVSSDRLSDYTPLALGDLLFAGSGESIEEIGKSAVSLIEAEGCCGGDIILFKTSREMNPKFIGYAADCRSSAAQKSSMGRGITVMHIYSGELRYLTLVLPPLPEQSAIVKFLTYMDHRIQRFTRAKMRLIKLLEEQKQAIILDAVTRGLDPDVQLKPSGVDWLGDVPEHWRLVRLKYLADIGTGNRDTINRVDGGPYPFFVRSQRVERIDSFAFDGEAVLTAGDGAGVAKVFHYVNGKFDFHQRVYKFSRFRSVSGEFFFYYLRSTLRFAAFRETAKSTVDSLRLPMLQNLPVLVPSLKEQGLIVAEVHALTKDLEDAIPRVRDQIRLVGEYRTRLISDVVTGKLDVREASLGLPDEEELEPLGDQDDLTSFEHDLDAAVDLEEVEP